MHPIERYRKAKGFTQGELAIEVGVSTGAVQGWERGSEPRPRILRKLAEVLDVDTLGLLKEIEEWKKEKEAA